MRPTTGAVAPGQPAALLDVIRREALTVHELEGVVDLLQRAPSRDLQQYILDAPREALSQADGTCLPSRDPRLSVIGNQVWRRLGLLLELLGRMERLADPRRRGGVDAQGSRVLAPRLARLSRDAHSVALLSRDLVSEQVPA